MKILTVSDVVVTRIYRDDVRDRLTGIDLILACGDLPAYYLEFLVGTFNVPLYYIIGNHPQELIPNTEREAQHTSHQDAWSAPVDPSTVWGQKVAQGPDGCVNIDSRVVVHKGLLIAGLEGSMWYNGGAYQYHEWDMQIKIMRLRPQLLLNRVRYGRYLDILITHAPPYQVHDDVDTAHRGFRAFRSFIAEFAPRYLIHGHTHVYMGSTPTTTVVNRTTVINTYGYRILDIDVPRPHSTMQP